MAVYQLITNGTAAGVAPTPTLPPPQAQVGALAVNPAGTTNANTPTQTQLFQLVGSASSGNITVVATIYVSNDGVTWTAYGTTMSPSAAASVNAYMQTSLPAAYFAASLTTLTGTKATASLTMSA